MYDNVLIGLPKSKTIVELAEEYLRDNGDDKQRAIESLIRWQTAKCTTSGFVAGLGGAIAMPVTIPLDLSVNLFVQMRMIATVAHICGHDIRSDKVRTLVYACMAGNKCVDILASVGIALGKKLTEKAIQSISKEVIAKINQAVGFRLVTKYGENGAIKLGKLVPVVGGFISGGFDGYYCNKVGQVTKTLFLADGYHGQVNMTSI
jgi:hypothetical protein